MIKILSDSTCDLSPELIQKYDIGIIPLYVRLGDEEYLDGVNISPEQIYKWSDEHGETPKTAAASMEDISKYLDPSGTDELVDERIYRYIVGGVDTLKSRNSDGSEGENLWYRYDSSAPEDSVQRKSLNNRRLIIVATNDTYNERTDIGREESTMTYITLTRARLFMLE